MKPWMLATIAGGAKLEKEVITSSRMWTAPSTTSVSLTGKGSDGSTSEVKGKSASVIAVNYRTDTSTGSGSATWESFQGVAPAAAADLNADGVATWTYYVVDVWPDGTNKIVQQTSVTVDDAIPGSASVNSNMGTSGPITSSGGASISYLYNGSGKAGTAATGFGKTFPGGALGEPALELNFPDVPVSPGQQYPLDVPVGGSITISYYR
jgi:hypothetical protein